MFRISAFVLAFYALALQVSGTDEENQSYCDHIPDVVYNDLRVSWRPKKSCPGAFDKLPRTKYEARKMGFQKLKLKCSGSTLGFGYVKGEDKGLVLLFDKQGTVCGAQVQFRKEDIDKIKEFFPVDENVAFQPTEYDGEEFYTTAVYFMNPKDICTIGRSEEELEKDGTVQQVYFQIGRDPECDVVALPFNEDGFRENLWAKGLCRPGIGSHYVYIKDFDCINIIPFAPIYDEKGRLLGMAFGNYGCLHSTPRFDHTKDNFLKLGFPHPLPPCLPPMVRNTGGFTAMHFYFIDKPWEISCCS